LEHLRLISNPERSVNREAVSNVSSELTFILNSTRLLPRKVVAARRLASLIGEM
jgi:hypothetical protein